MDFVAARLIDGRWFRVSTVVDQFTRECLLLLVDGSLTGHAVALALSQVIAERGAPVSITVDNGTEFANKAMDVWAYQYRVQLDFIRPGRPVENSYIESFNGRLRHECLNVEVFFTIVDVRDKLERWRQDYNHVRPHSSLRDGTPAAFAAQWEETAALRPAPNPGAEKARKGRCAGDIHLSLLSATNAGETGLNRITQAVSLLRLGMLLRGGSKQQPTLFMI